MTLQKSSEPCPKCGQFYVIGQSTCSVCGLVFAKWERRAESQVVGGSQRMELAWQDVLNQWTDEAIHKRFVEQCQREHNLPFASQKYRKVLEADPHSAISIKMQKNIQQIVIVSTLASSSPNDSQPYSNKLVYMMTFFCALFVLMGLALPRGFLSTGLPLVLVGIFGVFAAQFLKRYFS